MNDTSHHPAPEELALLSQVIRDVGRSRRLSPEDAEDFSQSVHLRLLERDYDVLRRFTGRSSLRTYLAVVVNRMLLDWRNAMWGKWRASAAAMKLGDAAVALERLVHRDGFSTDEAIELVRATRGAPPADDLRRLAERLPPKLRRRDLIEHEYHAEGAVDFADPIDEEERRQTSDGVRRALAVALRRLSPGDRELIHLRYQGERSVDTLARSLRTTPKVVYRRLERARKTLRRAVTRRPAHSAEPGTRTWNPEPRT